MEIDEMYQPIDEFHGITKCQKCQEFALIPKELSGLVEVCLSHAPAGIRHYLLHFYDGSYSQNFVDNSFSQVNLNNGVA